MLFLPHNFPIVSKFYRFTFLCFSLFCASLLSQAQSKITNAEYIKQWSPVAMSNMDEFGVPASIILAQGLLESGSGNSELARNGNNHFGIKCHGWTGDKIYHDDDKKGECFRKYPSAQDSFDDHVKFLKGSSRYASLFELKSDNYKGWAKGLKSAGYATNPKYPQLLINIIEKNDLARFDNKKTRPKNTDSSVKGKDNKPKPKGVEVESPEPIAESTSVKYPVTVSDNRIKYVVAHGKEQLRELADALLLNEWQLKKYNDLPEIYTFSEGERVYIQPKRRNSKTEKIQVKEASNLREVSQVFGVKMKHLLRYNPNLEVGSTLKAGDVVWLKKH